MQKFVSGLTVFAVAVPLGIGIAFAESSAESMTIPTSTMTLQACVNARTASDDALIAAKNAQNTAEVAAIQAHKAALIAALALTDVAAKKDAFKKAETDLRASMKTSMDAFRTATKPSMDAVKAACSRPAAITNDARKMENNDKRPKSSKAGMMNKIINAFGHDKKMKGSTASSTANAQ